MAIKFYLKHHLVGGTDVLGFRLDRIRTLVSMAKDSSRRVIMGKSHMATLVPLFFIGSTSFLQVTRTTLKSEQSSNFGQIRQQTAE